MSSKSLARVLTLSLLMSNPSPGEARELDEPGAQDAFPELLAAASTRTTVYVDDDPGNNGSVRCPATPHTTIEEGVAAIGAVRTNVTLNICPGRYESLAGYRFALFTNLRIVGLGNPVVTLPLTSPPTRLLQVADSTNVAVQGLVVDGRGRVPLGVSAIQFERTSGIIKGNTIAGWHTAYSGPTPFPVQSSAVAIFVTNPGTDDAAVQILNNSIYDSQDVGILLRSGSKATVMRNRIVFGSGIVPVSVGASPKQAGIALYQTAPGAVVSGNQIESDADLYPQAPAYARGILLLETSGARVTGNTVRGAAAQIGIENWCTTAGSAAADDNVIQGNKLYDTFGAGVYITARNDTSTNCGGIPRADNNLVKGNTIHTLDFDGSDNLYGLYGVYLETQGDGVIADAVVTGNTIAGFASEGVNPSTVHANDPAAAPGLIRLPNRILAAPPAGPYKR